MAAADGHVVGNDVEDLAEITLAEPRGKACMRLAAAQLFIDLVVIDDVVAVFTARCRLQIRRTIDVGDAEILKIVGDVGGASEAEIGVQLEAVRREGNAGHLW